MHVWVAANVKYIKSTLCKCWLPSDHKHVSLSVCSKPQLLMDPPDTKLFELSFTMQWDPLPNTTLLHSFTVYYNNHSLLEQSRAGRRQLPDGSFAIDSISASSLEYKVDNLLPYSTYCFWLQAVYAQGNVMFDAQDSQMLCEITTPAAGT